MGIHFVIDQGKRYYFRDITWTGNSEYTEEQLNSILRIEKGSIYDVVTMEKRLFGGDKENDLTISKLYRDQGYLFFNVTPVELTIEGDSVDVEMRMIEGKPATFNNIIINGNTITNEKVVRRAVFTVPDTSSARRTSNVPYVKSPLWAILMRNMLLTPRRVTR